MQLTSARKNTQRPTHTGTHWLVSFLIKVEVSFDGIHISEYQFGVNLVRGPLVYGLKSTWYLRVPEYDPIGASATLIDFKAPFIEVLPLPEWCKRDRLWECPSGIESEDEIVTLAKKMCVASKIQLKQ